ncbi:acylphosphatase [Mucisphaera calidilacus]|uniref:acylphosphatase n=1 Tax=Mucisphaera calidilacus TaxID=2527982 RepID=A0A518C173_9BACT|nr:acylphosphatase [Mucisphaera calidilacus]QDU72969.1 Acylphosphatase [Mucisphaera calidilacus]
MERRRVLYAGRVQGVGFRYTAERLAGAYPISGYVKNLADGRVELEAQGMGSDLDAFVDRLGLEMGGKIASATRSDLPVREGESGFEIRY